MGNTTKQVPCTKSLNISSSNPFTNFKDDDIYVGCSTYCYRGYLYFNLPTPPQNMTIDLAYLKIYLTKYSSPDNNFNLYIYPLTEPFDNHTNYNNQPSHSNKYISASINESPYHWITIDITSIVKDWYNGAIDNNGILLKSNETSNSIIAFSPNFSCCDFRPKLYLNYSCGNNHLCENTITTTTLIEKSISTGNIYYVTTGNITIVPNAYIAIEIKNNSSNMYLYLLRLYGGSSFNTEMELIRDGSILGGKTITPRNANTNYPDDSIITSQYITQATIPITNGTVLGCYAQGSGVVQDDINGLIKITPGHSISIMLRETDGRDSTISINCILMQSLQ